MILQSIVSFCTRIFVGLGLPTIEEISIDHVEGEGNQESPVEDPFAYSVQREAALSCSESSLAIDTASNESEATPCPRKMPEYAAGREYFRPGMPISFMNDCPHLSGEKRIAWMTGFVDAYCQSIYTRHGLGCWLNDD